MRIARALVAAAVGVLTATMIAGCAQPFPACAGAAAGGGYVELWTYKWFPTHPDSTLTACFDSVCHSTADRDSDLSHLELPQKDWSHPEKQYTLAVSATRAGQEIAHDDLTLHLTKYTDDTACGPSTSWWTRAEVRLDGTLALIPKK